MTMVAIKGVAAPADDTALFLEKAQDLRVNDSTVIGTWLEGSTLHEVTVTDHALHTVHHYLPQLCHMLAAMPKEALQNKTKGRCMRSTLRQWQGPSIASPKTSNLFIDDVLFAYTDGDTIVLDAMLVKTEISSEQFSYVCAWYNIDLRCTPEWIDTHWPGATVRLRLLEELGEDERACALEVFSLNTHSAVAIASRTGNAKVESVTLPHTLYGA